MINNGRPAAALATKVAFLEFLRAKEVLDLHLSDFCLAGDTRLFGSRCSCAIPHAKTGSSQFVPIDDYILFRRVSRWSRTARLLSSSKLFNLSYAASRCQFRAAIHQMDLEHNEYILHSLRHGGATTAWLTVTSYAEVKVKGRWVSDASCRRYINAGKIMLLLVRLRQSMASCINTLAVEWSSTINRVTGTRRDIGHE